MGMRVSQGTWFRHCASCRDADPQSDKKPNSKLGPYSAENGPSKCKQLENFKACGDTPQGTEMLGTLMIDLIVYPTPHRGASSPMWGSGVTRDPSMPNTPAAFSAT